MKGGAQGVLRPGTHVARAATAVDDRTSREALDARTSLTTWLLLALWVLNAVDFLLTTKVIALGIADEANVIMDYFLDAGLGQAFAFKVGVVSAGVLALWLLRRRRVVLVAAAALTALYALVVLYQLAGYWRVVML